MVDAKPDRLLIEKNLFKDSLISPASLIISAKLVCLLEVLSFTENTYVATFMDLDLKFFSRVVIRNSQALNCEILDSDFVVFWENISVLTETKKKYYSIVNLKNKYGITNHDVCVDFNSLPFMDDPIDCLMAFLLINYDLAIWFTYKRNSSPSLQKRDLSKDKLLFSYSLPQYDETVCINRVKFIFLKRFLNENNSVILFVDIETAHSSRIDLFTLALANNTLSLIGKIKKDPNSIYQIISSQEEMH
jgi:hypothetical protein